MRWLSVLAAMAVVGCAEGESFEGDLESRAGRTNPNSRWGCRTCGFANSPRTGTFLLSNFGVGVIGGAASLVALEDPWFNRVDAEVDEFGDFVANDPSGKRTVGADLIGWKLIMWDADSQQEYAIEIYDHEMVPDWATGALMPTYGLAAYQLNDPDLGLTNVCPDMPVQDTTVVLTRGQSVDEAALELNLDPDRAIMACVSHNVAKSWQMTHDDNVPRRQAALKMLAADYCGDGYAGNTTVGTPIEFSDAQGSFPVPPGLKIEAAWEQGGALCVNTPRQVARQSLWCGASLPTCDRLAPAVLADADWISYHPATP